MHQDKLNQQDLLEAALAELGLGHPAALQGTDGDTTSDPASDHQAPREHLEILGLLAYQLEPEEPSPAVRDRLMAAIAAPATPAGPVVSEEALRRALADVIDERERFAERRESGGGSRLGRWSGLPAAALAVCLIGLGYLMGQTGEQRKTIDRLDRQVAGYSSQIGSVSEVLHQLDTMERKFKMVTQVARRAYPMETVIPSDPGGPHPDGMIYVCGQHQRWYLNVDGLEPPPPGKEYRLWFLTDKGPVPGGVIDVEPGVVAEKEANDMPQGTRGFSITLEDSRAPADHPEGMMVLLGEDSVSL